SAEIREYAAALEKQEGLSSLDLRPPPLQGRQSVTWSDLDIFTQGLGLILGQKRDPIERRLRKCLALADICRKAKFDKVSGSRLEEFLGIVIGALDQEVVRDPQAIAAPTWVGRILFRQILVLYARKDLGQHRGKASRNRLTLLKAAWGFARGTGPV